MGSKYLIFAKYNAVEINFKLTLNISINLSELSNSNKGVSYEKSSYVN